MPEKKALRQIAVKDINWYGSVASRTMISRTKVFSRVESLTHRLLENNVLQVDVAIKLFAVPGGKKEPDSDQAARCYTNIVQTSTFIKLRPVTGLNDILSIRHELAIQKITARPGRISVIGSLKLAVEYLSPVSLNGRVTIFTSGQPLKGTTIKVLDMESGNELYETTTAADGTYSFDGIDAGTYLVRALADGFEPQEQIAVIMLQDTVNFVLHRWEFEPEKDAV